MKFLYFADAVGRAVLCGTFALVITVKVGVIRKLLSQDIWSAREIASACAEASVIAFLALICMAVAVRLPPIRSVDGAEPYVTAMVGTFLIGAISYPSGANDLANFHYLARSDARNTGHRAVNVCGVLA